MMAITSMLTSHPTLREEAVEVTEADTVVPIEALVEATPIPITKVRAIMDTNHTITKIHNLALNTSSIMRKRKISQSHKRKVRN